jgi:hypothetical protein
MGTLVNVLLLIASSIIGVGISFFIIPELLPWLDEQTRIIIAVVLTLFSFVSLYFMAKGHGGS